MANQEHVEILTQGVEVWNKWRQDNSTIRPDLSYSIFFGEFLVGANLRNTNLEGADLSRANLEKADFSWSNVHKAELKEAELSNAVFEMTNFTKANLSKSVLYCATFDNTELTETNFSEAEVSLAKFIDLDLSSAVGLETIEHGGPSNIDLDTIITSKGIIPDIFLRGCGVPEDFITYLPSLLAKPIEYYSCFISYSHADKAFARQLHDFLQGRGIRCWLDEHQLLPGHDIFEEVDRGIKLWDKVLLCASKDSLSSWWVDNEINRAFKKEQTIMKSRGKKVLALIPLDLDGFIFSDWENGKAEQVKARLAADFQGWQNDNDKLQQQFERVVKALRTDGGREAPPVSRL